MLKPEKTPRRKLAMASIELQNRRKSNNINFETRDTKRIKRTEVLEKKKLFNHLIKTADSVNDHLAFFSSFRNYNFHGLSVHLESGRGNKLSPSIKQHIQSLLLRNMKEDYGSEWHIEEKIKWKEMVSTEARYVFVHEAPHATSDTDQETKTTAFAGNRGLLVGFVHFRFTLEEEVPVLYVYELQLEPRVQGKALGKFLMQLIELIAQKNRMGAVVLTVLKRNIQAMRFYVDKLRYNISSISPSKVDPLMWRHKSYEILCKTFDQDAKAYLEDKADDSVRANGARIFLSHTEA